MAELNKRQVNFELDEDEQQMLIELIALESARSGHTSRSKYGGKMIREKHSKEFPGMWDGEFYKPRLNKLTG